MFRRVGFWFAKKVILKLVRIVHGKIDTDEERFALATKIVNDNHDKLIAAVAKALKKGDIILDKVEDSPLAG
jgi:hypothetical protein